MMSKIVSKPHNTHILEARPANKDRINLGEYRYGTGQKPFEG